MIYIIYNILSYCKCCVHNSTHTAVYDTVPVPTAGNLQHQPAFLKIEIERGRYYITSKYIGGSKK